MTTAVVGTDWHRGRIARRDTFLTAATIAFAVTVAGPARANPDQPSPPLQLPVAGVECNGILVPLDPPVSYKGGLGTLIYLELLKTICGQPAGNDAP